MVEKENMRAVYIRAAAGAFLIGAGLTIMISAMHATPCDDCDDEVALPAGEDEEPEVSSASAEEEKLVVD